jgi:hypothetical protein
MKRAEKEVTSSKYGKRVQVITSSEYRRRQAEKANQKKTIVDKVLELHVRNEMLDPPIPIPRQYLPLLLKRIEPRKRGRPKHDQSAEQSANDESAFRAVSYLIRDGWSISAAASAVGNLMGGLTRQAIVEAYDRVLLCKLCK